MAINYKPGKSPFFTDDEVLTEQEHLDSCDINKMVYAAARGYQVRGGNTPVYGYDDTTMDLTTHRIIKDQVEQELQEIAESTEIDENLLEHIPKQVREKFNFKVKKTQQETVKPKNDDDQTTTNPKQTPAPTTDPKPNPL